MGSTLTKPPSSREGKGGAGDGVMRQGWVFIMQLPWLSLVQGLVAPSLGKLVSSHGITFGKESSISNFVGESGE